MPEIFLNRVFFLVRAKTSKGAYFTMQKVILVCILPTICSKVFFFFGPLCLALLTYVFIAGILLKTSFYYLSLYLAKLSIAAPSKSSSNR